MNKMFYTIKRNMKWGTWLVSMPKQNCWLNFLSLGSTLHLCFWWMEWVRHWVSGGQVVGEEKPGIKSLQNVVFLRKCFRGLETPESLTRVLLSCLHSSWLFIDDGWEGCHYGAVKRPSMVASLWFLWYPYLLVEISLNPATLCKEDKHRSFSTYFS